MNQTISKEQVVSQVEGNIVSDMDGEKVMLSIQNGKYYNLGEIGGEIWEYLKSPITIKALITRLLSQYDVGEKECEEQVMSFLNHLLKEGLIQIDD
ncbi:lasso peptide biosynthesis PqqD family chaperone [Oceanobacillus halophilus]|uniref:Lasso peptide biosynthesis PqqD family chaperone n=1 Tax=Oceanobacillus halophilus TaxID=930130 RepID=A0A495A2F3_9BACI|nr:lasso peptide biosynthesis PqqD family chaperone [Oceanobacillus halophilus]RKQ33477.1 lasso peptide biosynthesis PqqD family chaperone [Oceanobacillus halophilus]